MGAKVPRVLRVEVIRKWLQGETRDRIANEVGIGAGTVSGIIKEYKRDDSDADLLREVALKIKHEGMDIQSFAPLIRLRDVLKQREWILGIRPRQREQERDDGSLDDEAEKKMESLIISLEVFCFKRNLTIIEFFDSIYKMYLAAEKFDIPIEEFPSHVQESEARIETLTEDNRIAKKELEEFKVRNQNLIQQLFKVEEEATKYKISQKLGTELDWMIEEEELEKLNEDLGTDKEITPSNLKEMLMDVYYHPSKYGDIVSELTRRSIGYGPLSESFRRWLSRKK